MILLSISLKVSVRQPPTALFSLGPGTPGTPGTPLLESIIEGVLFLVPPFGSLGSKAGGISLLETIIGEVATLVLSFVVAGVFGIEYHFAGGGLQSFFLM